RRRIINFFSELVFAADSPQLVEPRDVIWAAFLLVLGAILSVFGLKELLAPRAMVRADSGGLHLRIAGPFRAPVVIPWDALDDIGAEQLEDDGDLVSVMWLRFKDWSMMPTDPWGARWIDGETLALLAADWEVPAREVAEKVADIAVASSARPRHQVQPPPKPESTWPWDIR
ncbi:MAG: hypothetical protein WD354_00690, partial [Acidimicrobiia bacterium]